MTDTRNLGAPSDPTRRCVRVIWNPSSGSKGGIPTNRVDRARLETTLARIGLDAEIIESGSAGEARAQTQRAARDGYDLVAAAGGDGTIASVAGQLVGSSTALGVLPLGSVMNIPRMLGVPRDLDEAAALLAHGRIQSVDVGEANGILFFEAGSVGMNAVMFREAQRFDRGDWWSIVRTVFVAIRYRPARMTIRLDDRIVRTRALMVSVANGPYTGAGMTVAPAARLDDGHFDIRVFRGFSKLQLLRHLGSIAFGRRRYEPQISTYRSRRVHVESARPLPCRADSRDLGRTPVTFVTRPGALRVVVPASLTEAAPT
jgi:YegS/Rv2252/BmrU family lipid kinase